jgi:FtsP/CotA-like multicopper oxidase with cupredoxin domain
LLVLAAVSLFWGVDQGRTQTQTDIQPSPRDSNAIIERMENRVTQADREAAAERQAAARAAATRQSKQGKQAGSLAVQGAQVGVLAGPSVGAMSMSMPSPGGTPDYFNVANWANSPLPTVDVNGTIIGGIQKFVDTLPGLGYDNRNNLGQYIPVAVPDINTYSSTNSDYYVIGLQDYNEQMHSNLPATKLRGYLQLNTTDPNVNVPRYLGPLIIARKDRPVRVKFINQLGIGAAGDLFLPVDTTVMGAGMGPDNDANGNPINYQQNRATLHLHGGLTPWISDGTPHQWTVPIGDVNAHYQKGVSTQNVPDMPDPGQGSMTFYYPNQQTARLMFYHDHAYGITRLNVYAGEAAGYLLTDPNEEALINSGVLPDQNTPSGVYRYGIPLIIQDKTFVDANNIGATDPTWNWGSMPGMAMTGDLWFPHVYMPNQNPADPAGANAFGRWDYGPWFWPPIDPALLAHPPITLPGGTVIPGTPNPSMVMEAFMDTPIVNGTPYPVLPVGRRAYRFRILNACNDRYLNLQLYYADTGGSGTGAAATATVTGGVITGLTLVSGGAGYSSGTTVNITDVTGTDATATATVAGGVITGLTLTNGGNGYSSTPVITITSGSVGGTGALATATVTGGTITGITVTNPGTGYTSVPSVYIYGGGGSCAAATATVSGGVVTGITVTDGGMGFTSAPTVLIGSSAEVKMVPAVPHGCSPNWPATWPTDGRDGGVPDPITAGPPVIRIGTEGGFLPAPVVIPSTPIGYEYNRRNIVVLNVSNHSLYLGPAERADIIIDFSQVPDGSKIILYNDAPAPDPGFDPRLDYYTGDPNQTDTGGAPTTLPGYGPNTRTIMQFQVAVGGPVAAAFDVNALNTALPAAYTASQDAPIVPETTYPTPYQAAANTYSKIQDTNLTFTPIGSTTPTTVSMKPKAIQELFELDYGRMNSTLGVELPFTNFNTQTTIPYGYIDPPTEIIQNGGVQIWKITHNGVDTHAIHVHLFNVQLINRVGWDGMVKPPDRDELGWKETVKMNPLEDCIVALKPIAPTVPFAVPDSNRLLDPTMLEGSTIGFSGIDPNTGNAVVGGVSNVMTNFGWEYVWHCHLLGHEEMDMMRPVVFQVAPGAPTGVSAIAGDAQATVSFTAPVGTGGSPITSYTVTSSPGGIIATGPASPITVTGLAGCTTYTFTVTATNAIGTGLPSSPSNSVTLPATVPEAPTIGTATAGNAQATVSFTPPVSTCSAIISYTVTSSPDGKTATGASSPITVTGLTNGTAYTFTVTATNVIGTGPASGPSNSVTPATVPGAPTIGTAVAGNARATVSFTAPASNGGSPITLYTVTSSPGGKTATGASSPITVTGLTNGTAYTFTVKATNAVGTGPASGPSNSVTPTNVPPAVPSNLVATASVVSANPPTVSLTWRDNSNNETGFLIQRATNAAFTVGANVTTYTDTTVLTNTRCYYRVRAFNAIGNSAWSASSAVVTPGQLPAAPTNLTLVGVTRNSITISWTDNSTNELKFYVQRSATGTGGWTLIARAAANTITYTDSGLSRNTTYYYRVQAYNANGTSAFTNTVSGKTLP